MEATVGGPAVVTVTGAEGASALHEFAGSELDGVPVRTWDGSGEPPADTTFWVPPFLSGSALAAAARAMPRLSVVQLMSAGADAYAGRLPGHIRLCDARGVHSSSTSEWVLTAILASVREFPRFVRAQERGEWDRGVTDEVAGKRVLVVGAGSIGGAVRDRLLPFDAEVTMVARRARDGVHAVEELPTLLPAHDVVTVLLPLTDATRTLVDADFLSRMRDGALLVNAARGEIVDTQSLLAELTAGRLRAALDVVDPEPLPAGHPMWVAPNLLLTPHVGGAVRGFGRRAWRLVADQFGRYVRGEDVENVVIDGY